MYQALYRKYRPKTFNEVVGQDVIVKTLKNEITRNKINHAYLFAGPRGCGKTSIAKLFARVINCENPIDFNPCNSCVSCLQTQNTDIIEIDAASNNGVDEIREIRNKVNLVPSTGKYKIYIIDEVHMLTTGAFNALLKTLEEPPSHAIFILATTDPHKIPTTILSRCQRFDFKKVKEDVIVKRLSFIAESEQIEIEDAALKEIAFIADGGMRDAISILDQAVAYSTDVITLKDINDIVGTISNSKIDEFINNLIENKINDMLMFSSECNDSGKNMIKVAEKIMYQLKNILIEQIKKEENNIGLSKEKIIYLIKELNETISSMKKSNDPKLLFDLFIIKNSNVNSGEENKEKVSNVHYISSKEELPDKIVDTVVKTNILKQTSEDNNNNVIENKKTTVDLNVIPKENENLKKLVDIRIGNALSGFNKKLFMDFKNNIYKMEELLLTPEYSNIVSLVLDGDIKALGNNYIIFVYKTKSLEDIFNYKILEIEDMLENVYHEKYKVIATNNDSWEIIKKEFNSKTKKYVFVPETSDLLDFLHDDDDGEKEENIDNMFGSIVEYQ